MREFNKYERLILRLLYQVKIPLTAYEISKKLQVSHPTIKKYLDDLSKENLVLRGISRDNKKRYKFNETVFKQ